MNVNRELEFGIPAIMREPEFEGLTYFYRFLDVKYMDWVRGRVKVIVPVDRINKIKEIALKSNFELVEE